MSVILRENVVMGSKGVQMILWGLESMIGWEGGWDCVGGLDGWGGDELRMGFWEEG